MERALDLVQNMNPANSFQGNTNTMLLRIDIRNSDAVGDILHSCILPGGFVYTDMEIRTAGNTAGLTLDIGWRGAGENRDVAGVADQFGSAVAVDATGRQELMDVSFPMDNFNNRQIQHQLIITPRGVLTVGDVVELKITSINAGLL